MEKFSGFERAMIGVVLGNTVQRKPADMRMAVQVLDRLGVTEEMMASLDGLGLSALVIQGGPGPVEVELTSDETKFITKVMVNHGQFGGRVLRLLIPLWERLYPNWEELAPEPSGERGRPARRTPG